MHEANGGRLEAQFAGCLEAGKECGGIEAGQLFAVRIDPFLGFKHLGVQRRRPPDLEGKQVRPVLVADQQSVGVAFGDHQQGGLAASLKERVGGHSSAHLQVRDKGLAAGFIQQSADGMYGCVGIT